MSSFFEFVSNNALASTLVGAAILGVFGWLYKKSQDTKDSKAIYAFMITSQSKTGFTFRTTQAIASHTKLTEERVATLCSRHPNIRRNEKELQSWTLVQ
jgi:hypothetical protein